MALRERYAPPAEACPFPLADVPRPPGEPTSRLAAPAVPRGLVDALPDAIPVARQAWLPDELRVCLPAVLAPAVLTPDEQPQALRLPAALAPGGQPLA